MNLTQYNEKRNFKATPEPEGKVKFTQDALRFVVQRHAASHLHYDFRLEMGGVLKSWAVPKGPSMNPHDKRLAIMVEDHPLDYGSFEGVIPEGNYGAGIVNIWDKGTYNADDSGKISDSEKILLNDLGEGTLKFVLHGKKLNGGFALVKMHGREDDAWLLIKQNDEFATDHYNSEDYVMV